MTKVKEEKSSLTNNSTEDAAYLKDEMSFLWLVKAEKNLTGLNPDLCVALFTHPSYEVPSLSP